jgi:hypothetical protein
MFSRATAILFARVGKAVLDACSDWSNSQHGLAGCADVRSSRSERRKRTDGKVGDSGSHAQVMELAE